MIKQEWAKIMIGAFGTCKEYSAFKIVSWVDPDNPKYPDVASDIIIFIVENENGLPGYITKKFLKKYRSMTKREMRKAFKIENFDEELLFKNYKEKRETIKQQICQNWIGEEVC